MFFNFWKAFKYIRNIYVSDVQKLLIILVFKVEKTIRTAQTLCLPMRFYIKNSTVSVTLMVERF